MRALLAAVPLTLAVLAPAAHAAEDPHIPSGLTCVPGAAVAISPVDAGVCAGFVCVDLCGPILVVDPYCSTDGTTPVDALCAAIDGIRWESR